MRRVVLLLVVFLLGFLLVVLTGLSGGGSFGGGLLQLLAGTGTSLVEVDLPTAVKLAQTAVVATAPAPVPTTAKPTPAPTTTGRPTQLYGFYLHVYRDPAAVVYQVRSIKKWFPGAPIYIMSDGGNDFGPFCRVEGCHFELCPPANDRWHPWPFFRRIWDAAMALDVEYVIMLEPDNTIHGPIRKRPEHGAGGLLSKDRSFALATYVEGLASAKRPGFRWTRTAMESGLCGGSYFRREAILDAFSDEAVAAIDWNYVGEQASKEMFSSDFAMQYLLAARAWPVEPWEESAQMDRIKDQPLTGTMSSAFRHYCSCYPGGKPTYNLRMLPEDAALVKEPPAKYNRHNSVCQLCYNLTRYKTLWGSDRCTNKLPFNYSKLLMQRHHPELKDGCPGFLPWLCEPRH